MKAVAFAGVVALVVVGAVVQSVGQAFAQTPPSAAEVAAYDGLHAVAAKCDAGGLAAALATPSRAALDRRDGHGRTPLHVAAHASCDVVVSALALAGADVRAKDSRAYDIVTIAAVKDDARMLKLALSLGADPKAITSPYDGTALIAAAHLGHDEVVAILIAAGAPLDHVNNLGWTAAIEAVILGDGGPRHQRTLKALVDAGANVSLADREGRTPLAHARSRGFSEMVAILEGRSR